MDIFNGNRKLEEAIMYALDWGVFLRSDLDGQIAPFMYLFNGEEIYTRVLMTEDNPLEYAKIVLVDEKQTFQQFVIGAEGYLSDEKNERVDAIMVYGFDKTQEKGVALGQMFEPKEKNGLFRKIDKVRFLGQPDLLLEKDNVDKPDYGVEEVGFNGMTIKDGELTKYVAFFTHKNLSVVANTIKRYLRAKLTDNSSNTFSGKFDLQITPGLIRNDNFLKFLVLNVINEERNSPYATEWEKRNGRSILFKVKHGDVEYLSELEDEKRIVGKAKQDATDSFKFSPLTHLKWKSMLITDTALIISTKKHASLKEMSKNIKGVDVGEQKEEFWYRSLEEISYLTNGENLKLTKLNFKERKVSEIINVDNPELINDLVKAMSVEHEFTRTEEKATSFGMLKNSLLRLTLAIGGTSALYLLTYDNKLLSMLILAIGCVFTLFFFYGMTQKLKNPPNQVILKRVKK